MVSIEYANAYYEVLEILKCISKDEYKKIPQDLINVYTENANTKHEFNYNPSKTLSEQNASKITKVIIAILFKDYWATEEQREKIKKVQRNNIIEAEMIKKEQYNKTELFKKETEKNNGEKDTFLIKKENKKWYQKIIGIFKKIFKK